MTVAPTSPHTHTPTVYCLQYDSNVHSKDIHATMTDKCCQARSRIRTHNPDSLIEVSKNAQNAPFSQS